MDIPQKVSRRRSGLMDQWTTVRGAKDNKPYGAKPICKTKMQNQNAKPIAIDTTKTPYYVSL